MNIKVQALKCSSDGVSAFPCNPQNKQPLVAQGFHAASTDPNIIKDWWNANPDALIGCPCGENGFFAVDLDLRDNANGLEAWYELNKQQEQHLRFQA